MMTIGQLSKLNKTIVASNAEFKKMSKPQKRVRIAQDVLAQIKARRLVPVRENGYICDAEGVENQAPDTEVSAVAERVTSCQVCGIGSLFVVGIQRDESLKLGDLNDVKERLNNPGTYPATAFGLDNVDQKDIHKFLGKYFTKSQLQLIEDVFETDATYLDEDGDEESASERFAAKYPEDEERLVAIMKNIVKNEGVFIP